MPTNSFNWGSRPGYTNHQLTKAVQEYCSWYEVDADGLCFFVALLKGAVLWPTEYDHDDDMVCERMVLQLQEEAVDNLKD